MFKYGVIYREAIRTPRFELCPLMNTTSSLRLVSQVIKLIKDNAPEMIHECPYNESFTAPRYTTNYLVSQGLNVHNRTLNTRTVRSLFPTGDYKVIVKGFINNETLGTVTFYLSYNSFNKDTFG